MATKKGFYLSGLSNQQKVINAIDKYGVDAFAVILKIEELLQSSGSGELPLSLHLYSQIGSIIRVDEEVVRDIVEYLLDVKYLMSDKDSDNIFIDRVKEDIRKANEEFENRSKALKGVGGRKKNQTPELSESQVSLYKRYIDSINETFGRNFKGDAPSKRAFILRLKKYSVEEMEMAMKKAKSSDYHKDSNYNYCTPEFFTREAKLVHWINYRPKTAIHSAGAERISSLSERVRRSDD
jgi:hypothetical protein